MFHLTFLTKETHPSLKDIQEEVQLHPRRNYRVGLEGYGFQIPEIQQIIHHKCGICVKKVDNISNDHLNSFIEAGKSIVLVQPQDFKLTNLLDYLEKGATVEVGLTHGFDLTQIHEMVGKGKERAVVSTENLKEHHAENILEKGGAITVTKDGLSPFAISRLVKIGEDRVIIDAAGFSVFRINKFIEDKGIIYFGEGNLVSQPTIKDQVKDHPDQIYINAEHFSFDQPWVDQMEVLGATIV